MLLQVRDIPNDLYETLSKVAKAENRSITQQTIILLRSALKLKQERITKRASVLEEIDKIEISKSDEFPDPAELIREERDK